MTAKFIKSVTLLLALCLITFTLIGCVTANNKPSAENNGKPPIENGEPPAENPPEAPPPTVEKLPLTPLTPATKYNVMVSSKTNGLNLRSAPNGSAKVLGQINKGDMVSYFGNNGDWYITKYRNKTAYVSAKSAHTELKRFKPAADSIEKIFKVGLPLLGIEYVYGAQRYHWGQGQLNSNFTINEFDCSSFTQYIYYMSHKALLDTTSRSQSVQGQYVEKKYLKRGDIMFFTNSSRQHLSGVEKVGHVGIYFGDNYILHTASDYSVVEFMDNDRWKYYLHSRRLVW